MNLDLLFQDFEARLAAQRQLMVEADAKEQHYAEFSKIQTLDRLAAQIGQTITLVLTDQRKWQGSIESIGLGWIQLKVEESAVLIPLSSVLWWEGGNRHSSVASTDLARKLSFSFALRALVRYRLPCRIFLEKQYELNGILERVGADFLEIKMHQQERAGAPAQKGYRTIPLGRIVAFSVAGL